MRIKTEWLPHLHRYRRRELEMIFGRCPENLFASGLELGCGDGYQSGLLARWVGTLISTDWDASALPRGEGGAIEYRVCDAEHVNTVFAGRRFDLVFSSNLLEHLPDLSRALRGIREAMADDGLTIHAVPSPFWKLCHLLLNAPNRCVEVLEKLTAPGGLRRVAGRAAGRGSSQSQAAPAVAVPGAPTAPRDNNPKTRRRRRSLLGRFLWPDPHGVSRGNIEELLAFRRARWRRELEAAGFRVIAVLKGPVASGYGFGFDRLRALLERLGLASEFIYIARKPGAPCRYEEYLARRSPIRPSSEG
jgi:SAM-dependent methyltransferase